MFYKIAVLFVIIFSLSSCFNEPNTGAKDVRFDRDACDRCRMVLSDPYFAAQIRYFPKGKSKSKVVKFDDIGCAMVWLQDKEFKDDAKTEIWVSNHKDRSWINARTATFVHKRTSPMEYGLGAQIEFEDGGLNYEQAKAHVYKIEERFNFHGEKGLHEHSMRDQSMDRKDIK